MPGPLDGLKAARPQGPTNEVEQELADILQHHAGKRAWYPVKREIDVDNFPPAPTGQLTMTPLNLPRQDDPLTEPVWEHLFRIAPFLKGRSPSVQYGPTKEVVDQLARSGFGSDQYDRTNLLGSTTIANNRISVNPRLARSGYRDDNDATIAHELGHAVNVPHGRDMDMIEQLTIMARDAQRLKQK